MKIRADVAALIREGHTNDSIARRVGCHRDTVANARRALRFPPADKLGRLYAEAVPSGRRTSPSWQAAARAKKEKASTMA